MKIKQVGSNMTELHMDDNTVVLFSYETPVACRLFGRYFKTVRYFSRTTTKHINNWLDGHAAHQDLQEVFDELVS